MEKIQKGNKAKYTGYLLTNDEYQEYIELQNKLKEVKKRWNEYKEQYNLI